MVKKCVEDIVALFAGGVDALAEELGPEAEAVQEPALELGGREGAKRGVKEVSHGGAVGAQQVVGRAGMAEVAAVVAAHQ